MGYKKQQWRYFGSQNYGHTIFELIIRDEMGNKIDIIRWQDEKGFREALRKLKEKYNLNPTNL